MAQEARCPVLFHRGRSPHQSGVGWEGRSEVTGLKFSRRKRLRTLRVELMKLLFSGLDNLSSRCHFPAVVLSKLEQLRELIRSYGSCLVAYSGGVDSVFLAHVAREVLGDKLLAVIADSPSLPRRELEEALSIARRFQIPARVVKTAEFENPNYVANPNNRCYFCKHELFEELTPIAVAGGFAVIAYGENASDVGDFRPGAQAAAKFQVRAPLKEVGLTKQEIRALSARLGLPTADKPQMACLSSRIPWGEPVTEKKLKMIEQAENFIRDLGFHDVRVRHHELNSNVKSLDRCIVKSEGNDSTIQRFNAVTSLARIEVGIAELPRLLAGENFLRVGEALKKMGYAHVTLVLHGYRQGSLNEAISLNGGGPGWPGFGLVAGARPPGVFGGACAGRHLDR